MAINNIFKSSADIIFLSGLLYGLDPYKLLLFHCYLLCQVGFEHKNVCYFYALLDTATLFIKSKAQEKAIAKLALKQKFPSLD